MLNPSGFAKLTSMTLGWFLLSVKNNKPSSMLTPYIGVCVEKLRKLPCAKQVALFVAMFTWNIKLFPANSEIVISPPVAGVTTLSSKTVKTSPTVYPDPGLFIKAPKIGPVVLGSSTLVTYRVNPVPVPPVQG